MAEQFGAENLRGLDGPKSVALDRFDNEALVVDPLEGVRDRTGTSRRAIVARALQAAFDHRAGDERTGRIVHRNDRRVLRYALEPFGHGQMAVRPTFDHRLELARGRGPGNFLQLRPRAGRANQNNGIDVGRLVEGGHTAAEHGLTLQLGGQFVETHAPARTGGDDDRPDPAFSRP